MRKTHRPRDVYEKKEHGPRANCASFHLFKTSDISQCVLCAPLCDSCLSGLGKQHYFSHGPDAPFFIHTEQESGMTQIQIPKPLLHKFRTAMSDFIVS